MMESLFQQSKNNKRNESESKTVFAGKKTGVVFIHNELDSASQFCSVQAYAWK
jgi:hypothetical protein